MKHVPLLFIAWLCEAMLCFAADAPPNGFYVVSQQAGPGLHYFHSAAFPHLGYIAEKPDLPISEIEQAYLDTCHQSSTRVHRDGSSERTDEERPCLQIQLSIADAKALEGITTAHIGSRVLLVFAGEPLFAPVIRVPINTQSLQLILPKRADAKEVKRKVDTLVRKR